MRQKKKLLLITNRSSWTWQCMLVTFHFLLAKQKFKICGWKDCSKANFLIREMQRRRKDSLFHSSATERQLLLQKHNQGLLTLLHCQYSTYLHKYYQLKLSLQINLEIQLNFGKQEGRLSTKHRMGHQQSEIICNILYL